MSLGSNGVDRVRSLQKIPTRLHGMNFCTTLARFEPSFVRQLNGTKCNQIVWNAPKHQFSSNGEDRVRSLRKTPTRLRGTNFCTRSARSAPSFERQPNGPKCTQMVRNSPKHEIRVQWGGSGAFVAKNFRCDFIAQTCPLIATVQPILHRVLCSIETLPNANKTKKCSKTWV